MNQSINDFCDSWSNVSCFLSQQTHNTQSIIKYTVQYKHLSNRLLKYYTLCSFKSHEPGVFVTGNTEGQESVWTHSVLISAPFDKLFHLYKRTSINRINRIMCFLLTTWVHNECRPHSERKYFKFNQNNLLTSPTDQLLHSFWCYCANGFIVNRKGLNQSEADLNGTRLHWKSSRGAVTHTQAATCSSFSASG